jgi:sulfatase maturation enzyme AslB (radical SAM superfamily)
MSNVLCPAIDVGLYLETNGDIKTCCSGGPMGEGALGNINKQPLSEIFTPYNKKYIEIRQELAEQRFPEYCSSCVQAEKITPTHSQYSAFTTKHTSPGYRSLQHVDLRWSNVCNLSCRYCNSRYSSTWAKIEGDAPESVNRNYHASILEEVKNSYDSLKEVFLLGGEPLLQKQNEELLKSCREDVIVTVFTNLATNLENNAIYKLLKEKSQVRWYVSFENVGDRFEYVRAGASWDKLVHNLDLLVKENQHISIIPVYSIWSATRLVEYYDFISQYPIGSQHWRFAQPAGGRTKSYGVIPDGYNETFKQLAIEQIDLVTEKYNADASLQDIKAHLKRDTVKPDKHIEFLEWTAQQEALLPPSKSFAELWPEVYSSFTN